jgi:hypothetical protein
MSTFEAKASVAHLERPASDGAAGMEKLLDTYPSVTGEAKGILRSAISDLVTAFNGIVPGTASESHWDELKARINNLKAINAYS